MNVKDFALVVVRLFGLWVLYECITLAERIAISVITPTFTAPDYSRNMIFASIFDFLLRAAIGIILVSKPEIVGNKLDLPSSTKTEMRLTTMNMMFLCFSMAGLVFLVNSLSDIVYFIVKWMTTSRPPFELKTEKAEIAAQVFKGAVGLWLLFGSSGIIRGLRSLRQTGTRTQREAS